MRLIIYAVCNKETDKIVYANCRRSKCVEVLEAMPNKELFELRYRWQSI
jgi:hypothetical protein